MVADFRGTQIPQDITHYNSKKSVMTDCYVFSKINKKSDKIDQLCKKSRGYNDVAISAQISTDSGLVSTALGLRRQGTLCIE